MKAGAVSCPGVVKFRSPEKGVFERGALRKFVANCAPNLCKIAGTSFRTSEEECAKIVKNSLSSVFETVISETIFGPFPNEQHTPKHGQKVVRLWLSPVLVEKGISTTFPVLRDVLVRGVLVRGSDTNWWCIYYFLPRGGHTFAKVCHRNGRCIAILFKSIGVRGCFDSPEVGHSNTCFLVISFWASGRTK